MNTLRFRGKRGLPKLTQLANGKCGTCPQWTGTPFGMRLPRWHRCLSCPRLIPLTHPFQFSWGHSSHACSHLSSGTCAVVSFCFSAEGVFLQPQDSQRLIGSAQKCRWASFTGREGESFLPQFWGAFYWLLLSSLEALSADWPRSKQLCYSCLIFPPSPFIPTLWYHLHAAPCLRLCSQRSLDLDSSQSVPYVASRSDSFGCLEGPPGIEAVKPSTSSLENYTLYDREGCVFKKPIFWCFGR